MVYLAAGIAILTAIVGTFFIKDYLDLTAAFIADLGLWVGIPWALKAPPGQLVDLIWRWKPCRSWAITATVVAAEPAADLALLGLGRVTDGLKPVRLGDSDELDAGEQVFVIGAPYGLRHTLTVGHVSARNVPATRSDSLVLGEFIQTDAAVNRGNSSGTMFNMRGDVFGISKARPS